MLNKLNTNKVVYKVKVSKKAKRMRIAVYSDASVVLTLPWGFGRSRGKNFIQNKLNWILKSVNKFSKQKVVLKNNKVEYLKVKAQALELANEKVYKWNLFYNFKYKKVNIKNQKTRWGSCSRKGNLNFNYRILHLADEVVDYLVVHELCHLQEFNHSKDFWDLVARTIPNYRELRHKLKHYSV